MRLFKTVAIVGAAVVLSAATHAAEDRPSITWNDPAAAVAAPPSDVSVGMDRIVYTFPSGTEIGTTDCGNTRLTWTEGNTPAPLGGMLSLFNQELTAAGFNPNRQKSLFEERTSSSDLIVGAGISGMKASYCNPQQFAPVLGVLTLAMQRQADVTFTVDWEVYHATERRVVFRTRTIGQAKVTKGDVITLALNGAFQQAARGLVNDPAFRAAVAQYSRTAPSANTVSAVTSSTANTTAGASGSTTTTTFYALPKIPLSTKPFSEGATDTRLQVVTVLANQSHGSGFFISGNYVLTNHHVVTDQKFVKLRMVTGRELLGEVLAADAVRDVALIQTEPSGLKGLPIRLDEPGIGTQVFVIGSPLDLSLDSTVSAGIVSAFRELPRRGRFLQSDANIRSGNSGGPMFDDKGNVVAISDLTRLDERDGSNAGINFFIPISEALRILNITTGAPTTAAR